MGVTTDLDDLLRDARSGEVRAIARLLSLVEDGNERLDAVVGDAYRKSSLSVVGVTGPPGVGKSTLVDRLIAQLRETTARVAVLAVDPSSPFTGGAILGDRVRMQSHASDDGVFIRSMASRGAAGGMALATPQAAVLLGAFGYDEVLIETVGVGQAEVDVAAAAATTVVVVPPEFGDSVQAAKAGLLEIGDVFVVNQSDRPGADAAVRRLTEMLKLAPRATWMPPVVATVATEGDGIGELWRAVTDHRRALGGPDGEGRVAQARMLILSALRTSLAAGAVSALASEHGDQLVGAVAVREIDPWSAARELAAVER